MICKRICWHGRANEYESNIVKYEAGYESDIVEIYIGPDTKFNIYFNYIKPPSLPHVEPSTLRVHTPSTTGLIRVSVRGVA